MGSVGSSRRVHVGDGLFRAGRHTPGARHRPAAVPAAVATRWRLWTSRRSTLSIPKQVHISATRQTSLSHNQTRPNRPAPARPHSGIELSTEFAVSYAHHQGGHVASSARSAAFHATPERR